MADFVETLLPSGRAIRVLKLDVKQYRDAKRRAGDKLAKNSVNYQDDLAHELLLTMMRGITPSPVQLVMTKPDDDTSPEFDFEGTLEQVPPGTWLACDYQSLVTAGPTALSSVITLPEDYDAACIFARQVATPLSPLELLVAGKKRMVSK